MKPIENTPSLDEPYPQENEQEDIIHLTSMSEDYEAMITKDYKLYVEGFFGRAIELFSDD